jgi:site-specific DNA recombinase
MILCATYNRQSLNAQQGIDTQRKLNREAAERRGWTVVEEYQDNDVSASKPRGPGTAWYQLFQDAKARKFTHVIATDFDRIARGQRDLLDLIDSKLKVQTLDGEIDLSTADGEARASNSVTWARFEVKRKSERQKRASEARAEKGIPHRGKRPFGWQHDGMTLVPEEAAWVRYAVDETLAGTSLRAIVRHLNDQQVPTSTGREWQGVSVRKLLMRRRNAGILERYGVRQAESQITPIITEDEQSRVEAILGARQAEVGAPVRVHWASSLAKCGTCGAGMRGHFASSGGNRYPFYVCDATIKRSKGPDGGKHPSIRTSLLESVIIDQVAQAFLFGTSEMTTTDAPARKALQTALSGAQEARQDIGDLWDAKAITKAERLVMLKENLDNIEGIREQLATLDAASASASMLAGMAQVMTPDGRADFGNFSQAKADLGERFMALDIEKRRQLVQQLLDVRVHPGRGPERIDVEHLVAVSLNEQDPANAYPWATEAADLQLK